jgi:hypothetical protein
MSADESTPEQTAKGTADHMCNLLIRQFSERGLPLEPLGEEMVLAGASILASLIGPKATSDVLARAAAAVADQLQG